MNITKTSAIEMVSKWVCHLHSFLSPQPGLRVCSVPLTPVPCGTASSFLVIAAVMNTGEEGFICLAAQVQRGRRCHLRPTGANGVETAPSFLSKGAESLPPPPLASLFCF